MSFSLSPENSFVSFDQRYYVTDNLCTTPPNVCYPIRFSRDVSFQMNVPMPTVVPAVPADDITITTLSNGVGTTVTNWSVFALVISPTVYGLFFDFSNANLSSAYNDGECFQIVIETNFDERQVYTSNECFQKITDTCFTTALRYWYNEDAFGFKYINPRPSGVVPWYNQIRLPLYFKNPVVNTEQEVYVRSDGTRKKLYARLSKQYQVITDVMSERMHENLVVALNHDKVLFLDPKGVFSPIECTFELEYSNIFPSMMLPVSQWPAEFVVYETPFNELNSNCV